MTPDGWELSALGRNIKLQGGFAFKSDDFQDNGIPIVRISNIQNERVALDGAPCFLEDPKLKRFLLKDGDILIAMSGATTGKTGNFSATDEIPTAYLNQRVGRFVVSGQKGIEPQFLWHLIATARFKFLVSIESIGGAQPNVSGSEIESLTFNLPPLPEQRKIADILSTWDAAIEKTEALLTTAKAQKRALMQSLLTGKRRFPGFEGQPWKEVRLRELVDVNPRLDVCPYDRRLTFLTMDAVTEEATIAKPIEGNWDTHLKGFTQFKDGDVLVAKITPCFENGKGCHASNLINDIGTGSTEFHVLRPKDSRDVRFIYHLTNSFEFRGRGALNMQGSAGQRRVPTDFIRAYPLNVPVNPEERKRIGDTLDQASAEIAFHQKEVKKLRTEKKALMQQLLTGKRRVTV